MYFDNFEKIVYDFKSGANNTNQLTLIQDITKNIRFKKEFLESLTIFEPYRIEDGDTPEIIAEKVYGTPQYHWIVMLANQRYDHVEDFPLTGVKLDKMIQRKYGNRANDIHHFESTTGAFVNGSQILTLPNPYFDEEGLYLFEKLNTGYVVSKPVRIDNVLTTYSGWIEIVDTNNSKIHINISNGGFKVGDKINIYDYYDDVNEEYQQKLIATTTVSAVSVPPNVFPVTNAVYEYNVNESKRDIKIIPKQFIERILNEFSDLME